jgi:hypothetical protein
VCTHRVFNALGSSYHVCPILLALWNDETTSILPLKNQRLDLFLEDNDWCGKNKIIPVLRHWGRWIAKQTYSWTRTEIYDGSLWGFQLQSLCAALDENALEYHLHQCILTYQMWICNNIYWLTFLRHWYFYLFKCQGQVPFRQLTPLYAMLLIFLSRHFESTPFQERTQNDYNLYVG